MSNPEVEDDEQTEQTISFYFVLFSFILAVVLVLSKVLHDHPRVAKIFPEAGMILLTGVLFGAIVELFARNNDESSSSSSSNHGPSSTRQQQQQQQSFPDNGATSTNVALDPLNLPAAALRTAIVQNVEQVEFIPHPNHSFQRPYDIDFFPFPVVIRFIMPQTPSNPAGSSVGFGAALTPAQSLRSSACCLFSLALCYQLNTNSQEKSIVIAMSLYQQAWSCLKDIIIDPSDSSILLSLSISMNMASCAQRLGLLDAARTWNDCMSSLLKLTAPSSEPPSMDDATSCDQQGESATERSDDRTYPSPLTATTAGGYSNPQDSTGRHKSPLSNEVRHFFFVSTVLDGRGSSAATA
mmetsp:Transcript_28550/g.78428  ORF Transcript_28550/g.78428 Transcript_28550/m.78428 type:complete len:353 (+) Transcript_28550:149-1207(+)